MVGVRLGSLSLRTTDCKHCADHDGDGDDLVHKAVLIRGLGAYCDSPEQREAERDEAARALDASQAATLARAHGDAALPFHLPQQAWR